MKDLITIIMPIYNLEKYIEMSINSVIQQTYENLEIILIDDGSTDKSGLICDEYAKDDKRIKVIHQKNKGVAEARNVGIQEATGKYITWIDGDDYIQNYYVEILYNAIKNTGKDIAIGKIKQIYNYNNIKEKEKYSESYTILNTEKSLRQLLLNQLYSNEINAKMYKKELFDGIQFPINKLYEDLATTYKIFAKSNGAVLVDNKIYNYYKRKDSIMNQKFNISRMDAFYFCINMIDFIRENFKSLEKEAIIRAYIEARNILIEIPNDDQYKVAKKEILDYIKENKKIILYRKIPFKLRMSLLPTWFGEKNIKLMWKLKMRGKKIERIN